MGLTAAFPDFFHNLLASLLKLSSSNTHSSNRSSVYYGIYIHEYSIQLLVNMPSLCVEKHHIHWQSLFNCINEYNYQYTVHEILSYLKYTAYLNCVWDRSRQKTPSYVTSVVSEMYSSWVLWFWQSMVIFCLTKSRIAWACKCKLAILGGGGVRSIWPKPNSANILIYYMMWLMHQYLPLGVERVFFICLVLKEQNLIKFDHMWWTMQQVQQRSLIHHTVHWCPPIITHCHMPHHSLLCYQPVKTRLASSRNKPI